MLKAPKTVSLLDYFHIKTPPEEGLLEPSFPKLALSLQPNHLALWVQAQFPSLT